MTAVLLKFESKVSFLWVNHVRLPKARGKVRQERLGFQPFDVRDPSQAQHTKFQEQEQRSC